jgi:hypothetical protein
MKCETCGRDLVLNFHHLIPQTLHCNKWFLKNFDVKDMDKRGMNLCNDCHKTIHAFYSEKQLGRDYNTPEKIKNDEKLRKAFRFFAKQRKK